MKPPEPYPPHTPGPWKADAFGVITTMPESGKLETICQTPKAWIENRLFGRGTPEDVRKWLSNWHSHTVANAKLIAAAPDLLKALQDLTMLAYEVNASANWREEMEAADAAITKATQ